MRKLHASAALTGGLLIACLFGNVGVGSQSSPQPRATSKPFLWRIEGTVPSYLYGTIHVPDPAVLELPDVVRRALDSSEVFKAELPLDAATQVSMLGKLMLPAGQDLRTLAGDELFGRFTRAVAGAMGDRLPPGSADLMATSLAHLRPWAAMSQVALLEFLPDALAGRQPLDAMLYRMASSAGKEVGGLETLDEQVAVFDAFTTEEQVRMLRSALDELDKARTGGTSSARQMVALYLDGNLDAVAAKLNEQYADDQALKQKLITHGLDERNTRMAERIAAFIGKTPAKSYFFALGAGHFAGETGIISQLTRKNLKITRLSASDAGKIGRASPASLSERLARARNDRGRILRARRRLRPRTTA